MIWSAEDVRQLRYRMGWSQAEMARCLKLELAVISSIEAGRSEIPADLGNALLRIFDQAEDLSARVQRRPLAEVMMRDRRLSQIHNLDVIDGIDDKPKHQV